MITNPYDVGCLLSLILNKRQIYNKILFEFLGFLHFHNFFILIGNDVSIYLVANFNGFIFVICIWHIVRCLDALEYRVLVPVDASNSITLMTKFEDVLYSDFFWLFCIVERLLRLRSLQCRLRRLMILLIVLSNFIFNLIFIHLLALFP